ncbi:MAG: heparinase II/III family protein [Saprospiraceae bacterium]
MNSIALRPIIIKFGWSINLLLILISGNAQSLQHPTIWITADERFQVLEKIEKYDWAKNIVGQLHEHVDGTLLVHLKDPNSILDSIPVFAENDHGNTESAAGPLAAGHNKILSLASNAGVLYYLTEEEKYAQFAADILVAYIDVIAMRTPQTTSICGYVFFDARTTYAPFAIAYDFIYDYLKKPGTKVYNKASGTYMPFDNAKAQKAIHNMVGNVLQEYGKPDVYGARVSNHPILTAPGALFGLLCIEEDAERERLFNVFWEKGTAHQNSFTKTILPLFSEQGIWPESLSYSFMSIITMVLNTVDRIKPEMKVTEDYLPILEGNFLFDYLRYPDRRFVRYGDSKRNNDGTRKLYRYTMSIAERRGYTTLLRKAQVALQQSYNASNGYQPDIGVGDIFGNFNPLELFWGLPIPETVEGNVDYNKPTVIIDHAGVALQRNSVIENNELYGLCGIIGGAHYVHSHCTGIGMELYGAGYVMGPNAGLPKSVKERKIPLHEHYFRLYAGNNTVVVNGTSHGLDEGSWKGGANVWQNTTKNIASEPKHLEDPISDDFNFATQFLDDEVNNCDQERTLSVIRTSETTAYYFDMFRSKSNAENKFHDYIYHNLGDATQLTKSKNKKLKVKDTDRYQNDIGDQVFSPGWRYFENTQTTSFTKKAINARFDIKYHDRYMHLLVPRGVARAYTKALAPPTREAENGYVDKKTQVLVIRQEGEAWQKPFLTILEPSTENQASVQSVEYLMDGEKVVGAKVISKVQGKEVTDLIICQDAPNANYQNKKLNLNFTGRFAVVRTEKYQNKSTVSLYIGSGEKLSFRGHDLTADTNARAFRVIE